MLQTGASFSQEHVLIAPITLMKCTVIYPDLAAEHPVVSTTFLCFTPNASLKFQLALISFETIPLV